MKNILVFLILTVGLHATAVTSITCSGQTATVNSTAHGLIASRGFSLSGTAPTFNGTASSVTANTFTFLLPAGTPCAGFTTGYTAVVPAKQIIDLNSFANPSGGQVTLKYLYWFTSAYPNPLPCATAAPIPPAVVGITTCPKSAWPGASAAENAAIVAGTTVETEGQMIIPASTSAVTVQTQVIAQYNTMQIGFANFLLAGGYWWDGSVWANH